MSKQLRNYQQIVQGRDVEFLSRCVCNLREMGLQGSTVIKAEEIELVLEYCLVIKTILKKKSVYPTKPSGLIVYQDLVEVKKSLISCNNYEENSFLKKLLDLLSKIIDEVSEYVKTLAIGYKWFFRIRGSSKNPR